MNIYHYAPIDSWRDIMEGSWKSSDEPGIGACSRVCWDNFDDEGARNRAVFGLLEPEPASWINNLEFPIAWESFAKHVGKLLLMYEPTDELVEKTFIIDWSYMERAKGCHKDDLGQNSANNKPYNVTFNSEKAYWRSRVPLADYIENPEAISEIVLPEVITMCNVPAGLIKIADTQPLLQTIHPHTKEYLLRVIKNDPDLEVLTAHIT